MQRAGGHVHWARDANEANAIITQIVANLGPAADLAPYPGKPADFRVPGQPSS